MFIGVFPDDFIGETAVVDAISLAWLDGVDSEIVVGGSLERLGDFCVQDLETGDETLVGGNEDRGFIRFDLGGVPEEIEVCVVGLDGECKSGIVEKDGTILVDGSK